MTDLFFEVHADLYREGPGDDESTLRAYAMLPNLPPAPRILDIGCGPGAQTLALLRNTPAQIIAVDNHQPFLDFLAQRMKNESFSSQLRLVNSSMFELAFDEKFDVLWSEGAIYIIGFEKGLREWKRWLKPGGCAAVTEITWLKPNPPQEIWDYWMTAYPGMADADENLRRLAAAGYREIGHFTIPTSAWLDEYYLPIETRIARLRETYAGDADAQAQLDEHALEIEMYRKYGEWYGYVFYVMQAVD